VEVHKLVHVIVQIKALRSVQPFAFASEAAAHGVETASDADAEMVADPAYRLDVLWNVDKHRRLAQLDWFRAYLVDR
jgi:hypothetical protein